MVTDGNNSFTIFIYQCGDLQWSRNGTTIGFGAGSEFFSNHWLSGTPNVSSIACLNTPDSQFFTLLYKLTEPRYSEGEVFVVDIIVDKNISFKINVVSQWIVIQIYCSLSFICGLVSGIRELNRCGLPHIMYFRLLFQVVMWNSG